MEHITYLLGAGASRKCLPIVSEMSAKVMEVADEFEIYLNQVKESSGFTVQEEGRSLIKDLKWLSKICDVEKNFSVDTLAKKMLLSENLEQYNKLKNILTLYFTLQQRFKSPDIRYDNFWASLLNERNKFPNNIKVLSWNYDFQMELTYQDFLNSDSLMDTSKKLNIITQKNVKEDSSVNDFTIFKLNGSATYNSDVIARGHNYVIDNIKNCSKEEILINAIDFYQKSNWRSVVSLHTHLSYAWEHDIDSVFYEKLQDGLEKTTILVVIGYSFPYFNREIDKRLLFNYMPGLKKVYFQDEKPDNVKERYRALNSVILNENLVSIHDTYQFYFPNEL